jgi:DNA-binding winged helix-turn-helix (wHTH) protein
MKVSFGRFVLDPGTRQLASGSNLVHLSPKAFSLLQLLIERRPAVVHKDEIASRIWPGVSVSDASLGGLVKEIRRALEDDPAEPSFIRTAHTIGYAFIASIDQETGTYDPIDRGSHRCWLAWGDRTMSLTSGENVIGRDPRCTVWLDASGVSRRHARIFIDATGATIEDLGSRNGTVVRDAVLTRPRRLEDGDRIDVGATTLTFREWSEDRAPRTEPLRAARRKARRA